MPIKATIFCLLMLLFAPATRAESGGKTISESTEWQRLDSVKWQRPDTTKRWFHQQLCVGVPAWYAVLVGVSACVSGISAAYGFYVRLGYSVESCSRLAFRSLSTAYKSPRNMLHYCFFFAKIIPISGMGVCTLVPECSFFSANLRIFC